MKNNKPSHQENSGESSTDKLNNYKNWNTSIVAEWLKNVIELPQYCDLFCKHFYFVVSSIFMIE